MICLMDNFILVHQQGIAKGVLVEVTCEFLDKFIRYASIDDKRIREDIVKLAGVEEGKWLLVPMERNVWSTMSATEYDILSYSRFKENEENGLYGDMLDVDKVNKEVLSFVMSSLKKHDDSKDDSLLLIKFNLEGRLVSPAEKKTILDGFDGNKGVMKETFRLTNKWGKYIHCVKLLNDDMVVFDFRYGTPAIVHDDNMLIEDIIDYLGETVGTDMSNHVTMNSLIALFMRAEDITDLSGDINERLIVDTMLTAITRERKG